MGNKASIEIIGISKEEIDHKVHEIYNHLNSHESNKFGLLSGEMGKIFFFFLYAKYYNNEQAYEKASELLTLLIDKLCVINISANFCDGWAGIAWAMNYLIKTEMIDGKSNNLFKSLNNNLFDSMIADINRKNYDYLHGAIGIGLYFTSVESSYDIQNLLTALKKDAIIDKDGSYKWLYYSSLESMTNKYNLGLAHGIPGIMCFLIKILNKDPNNKFAKEMLIGATKYILKCKQSPQKYLSYFPTYGEMPSTSRLGWCYGDICIAITLLRAAEILGNIEMKNVSLNILKETTKRHNIFEEHIRDAGFCHGSIGLFYMYQKLYKLYGDNFFEDYAQYWLKDVFKKSFHSDGIGGYKTYVHLNGGYFSNEIGLLDGASGIGLVLLSFLSNEQEWDECFLLS